MDCFLVLPVTKKVYQLRAPVHQPRATPTSEEKPIEIDSRDGGGRAI